MKWHKHSLIFMRACQSTTCWETLLATIQKLECFHKHFLDHLRCDLTAFWIKTFLLHENCARTIRAYLVLSNSVTNLTIHCSGFSTFIFEFCISVVFWRNSTYSPMYRIHVYLPLLSTVWTKCIGPSLHYAIACIFHCGTKLLPFTPFEFCKSINRRLTCAP